MNLAQYLGVGRIPDKIGIELLENAHEGRFRDTSAVESLLANIPMEEVSALFGPQSLRVTERHYTPWFRARQEELKRA